MASFPMPQSTFILVHLMGEKWCLIFISLSLPLIMNKIITLDLKAICIFKKQCTAFILFVLKGDPCIGLRHFYYWLTCSCQWYMHDCTSHLQDCPLPVPLVAQNHLAAGYKLQPHCEYAKKSSFTCVVNIFPICLLDLDLWIFLSRIFLKSKTLKEKVHSFQVARLAPLSR